MTAESFLDYFGLATHPGFGAMAEDLHEDFYDTGIAFLRERAETDPLLRAMLHPAYQTWTWVSGQPAEMLRPGVEVSHHEPAPYGGSRFVRGVIDTISGEPPWRWVHIEPRHGFARYRPDESRSFKITDWDPDHDLVRVPVPIDATTLIRDEVQIG